MSWFIFYRFLSAQYVGKTHLQIQNFWNYNLFFYQHEKQNANLCTIFYNLKNVVETTKKSIIRIVCSAPSRRSLLISYCCPSHKWSQVRGVQISQFATDADHFCNATWSWAGGRGGEYRWLCWRRVELPFFFTSADPYVLQKLLVTLEFWG